MHYPMKNEDSFPKCMFTIVVDDTTKKSSKVQYLQLKKRNKFRSGDGAMRAWLRWFCCCECVRGRDHQLLPSGGAPLKESCYYSYNVRRISSFGRAESKEALQWSGDEGDGGGDVEGTDRSPTPSPTATPARPPRPSRSPSRGSEASGRPVDDDDRDGSVGGGGDDGGGGGGRRSGAPWLKRLKRMGRPLPRLRLPTDGLACSTPDLARLSPLSAGGPRSASTLRPVPTRALGASSGCLARVPEACSRGGGEGGGARWSCTRSMESIDLTPDPSTPAIDDVFSEDGDSKTLARSVGLDMSLYSSTPSILVDPVISKSTSRLLLWTSKSDSKTEVKKESNSEEKRDSYNKAPTLPSTGRILNIEDFVDQPCGTITFTASFFQKNKKLCIQLNKLENLPPKGTNTVYDMVVRISILPSEKQVKMSQILRGSLSPMMQEDFHFTIKEPVGKVLRFSVFNALLQGKYDAIGHALFNIEDVMNGRSRRYTMKLSHQSQLEPSFGSIQVYLQHTQERLIVDVIQARNLSVSHIFKSSRSAGKFSTYVKVTFFCAGQKMKTKKSPVITGDRNPHYEYSCDFKTELEHMDDCYLVLSIILKINLRKDITLGRYILGPHFYSESRDLSPWGQVVLRQEEIHHWFHLYL